MPTTHDSRVSPRVIIIAITLLCSLGISGCRSAAPIAAGHFEVEAALSVAMLPRVIALAPADLRLVVKIAPHNANRVLEMALDGGYFRSSEEMLEGADAPRVRVYWFKGVPPGRYTVRVRLGRNDGTMPLIWEEELCLRGMGDDGACGLSGGGF